MKKYIIIFLAAIGAYLLVCTAVTGTDYLKFLKTRTETELDTDLIYQVYPADKIDINPSLEDVRLFSFRQKKM